jgi:hypothetical protein
MSAAEVSKRLILRRGRFQNVVPRRDEKQLNRGCDGIYNIVYNTSFFPKIRKYVLQFIVSDKIDVLIEKKTP